MNDEASRTLIDDGKPLAQPRAEIPKEAPEKEALDRIGQVVGGKYRLEELLGSGGMAHVYRAVHEVIGRGVAIKVLRRQFTFEKTVVGRFLREARTANSVRHPNVVSVMDVGTAEDGCPYLVQELLEGETLLEYVQKRGKLELSDVVELICPIIGAVAEAHASGVVHRDLKPENVFLAGTRGKRVPKLLDFGISKAMNAPSIESTAAGIVMGTPAYMAPELARAAKDADPRTDVWACGVMLFEALTGKVPFEGETVPMMFLAIATKDAARLGDVRPDIPPSVSNIVAKCLKRDASQRYPTATELAKELEAALDPKELALMKKPSVSTAVARPVTPVTPVDPKPAAPPRAAAAPVAPDAKPPLTTPKTLKMEAVRPEPAKKHDEAGWLSVDHTLPIGTTTSSANVALAPEIEGLRGSGDDTTEPAMKQPKPSERAILLAPASSPLTKIEPLVDDKPADGERDVEERPIASDMASIRRAPTKDEIEIIQMARNTEPSEFKAAAKTRWNRTTTLAVVLAFVLGVAIIAFVMSYLR